MSYLLDSTATAAEVLHRLRHATDRAGIPGPVAFFGEWLESPAVIAPSVLLSENCAIPENDYWVGFYGFPNQSYLVPTQMGGIAAGFLIQQIDGSWHWDGREKPAQWIIDALSSHSPQLGNSTENKFTTHWTAPEETPHKEAIANALDAIKAGDIYQACICTGFDGVISGDTLELFTTATAELAPKKAAYFSGSWGSIVSLSPELFIRRRANTVTSSPIKGTAPLSADPALLRASKKDIAENIMIVDLVRNDLGKLAIPGSTRVPELLNIRPAPGVWHLVSTIKATVPTEVTNVELFSALFPPASVTGTPKISAVNLISQWESHPRGIYCGAIGLATPTGNIDMNVAIRTIECAPDGTARLGVGGGITTDSVPDDEWQECLDKARSIIAY